MTDGPASDAVFASRGDEFSPPDVRTGIGVRFKLLGALAYLAMLGMAACAIAFLSYFHIEQSLRRIEDEARPTIAGAFALMRQAAEFSAISSGLMGAEDSDGLAAAALRLREARRKVDDVLSGLREVSSERQAVVGLRRHVDELQMGADRLATSIALRLQASTQRRQIASAIASDHAALMGALARRAQMLGGGDALASRALDELRSAGESISGILSDASSTSDADALPGLFERFAADSQNARRAAARLDAPGGESAGKASAKSDAESEPASGGATPTAALEALLSNGATGRSIFDARRSELQWRARGVQLEANVEAQIAALAPAAQQFSGFGRRISSEAAAESGRSMRASRIALIVLICVALTSGGALAWGVVDRGCVRRLEALDKTMSALADADPDAPAPRGDELDRMAGALEVLKREAIHRRERDLEKDRALAADSRMLEAALGAMFDGHALPMWIYELRTLDILAVNDAAAVLYGRGREAFATANARDLCLADDQGAFASFLSDADSGARRAGRHRRGESRWRQCKADGSGFDGEIRLRTLRWDDRDAALAAVVDITELELARARIAHLEHHDGLTDLPNRAWFESGVDAALARMNKDHGGLAVHCLGLDRLKWVNETLGHGVGDALLQAMAKRLIQSVRKGDLVARLSGDEFGVLQEYVQTPEQARGMASRLVDALAEPYCLCGHDIVANAKVGVSLAPIDGCRPEELMRRAAMALTRAKSDGRAALRFFEPELDARLQAKYGEDRVTAGAEAGRA